MGHATDAGRARENNEDGYLVLTHPAIADGTSVLLAVADGMGGAQAGDVASSIFLDALEHLFSSGDYRRLVNYNPQHPDYYIAALKELIEQINENIYSLATSQPRYRGMGTTGTVALLVGWRLYFGHVGDSRLYLMRTGRLLQLTEDHSWVAEQVAAGLMTREQAATHPKRNVVTRVLGCSLLLRVDRNRYDLEEGDTLILTTDGLTGLVQDEEICQIVSSNHPQAACEQLVGIANQRGGHDNITVIVAQVHATDKGGSIPGGLARGPAGITSPTRVNVVDTQKLLAPPGQLPATGTRSQLITIAFAIACLLASVALAWVGARFLEEAAEIAKGEGPTYRLFAGAVLWASMIIGFGVGWISRQGRQ